MKRIISFFLIVIICFSNTEMYQLLKTPKLISHYFQHNYNHSVAFTDFLKIHYFNNHPKDSDEKDDRQLPFKSDECTNNATFFLPALVTEFNTPDYSQPINYKCNYQVHYPTDYIATIFQPPRSIYLYQNRILSI
jgi:hypothetical protein